MSSHSLASFSSHPCCLLAKGYCSNMLYIKVIEFYESSSLGFAGMKLEWFVHDPNYPLVFYLHPDPISMLQASMIWS